MQKHFELSIYILNFEPINKSITLNSQIMKKQKTKKVSISRRENLKLIRERIALRALMLAVDETRAQDQLIRMIQETNIQVNQ